MTASARGEMAERAGRSEADGAASARRSVVRTLPVASFERGDQGGELHGGAAERAFEARAKQGEVQRGEDRGVLHHLHPGFELRIGKRRGPGSAHHFLPCQRGVVELGFEQPRAPALDGAGRVVEHALVGERHECIGKRLRRSLIAANRSGQRSNRGVDPLNQPPAGRLDCIRGDMGIDGLAVGSQQDRDQRSFPARREDR